MVEVLTLVLIVGGVIVLVIGGRLADARARRWKEKLDREYPKPTFYPKEPPP